MKILQIIQKSQFRGAELFACQLSEQLILLGHEVTVVTLVADEATQLPFSLPFTTLNANLKKRFWDFKAYKKLNDLIVTGQYDLVQANASDTLKYSAISKFLFGWNAKLVFRNANKIGDFLNSFPKKNVNRFFIKQVDLVASVSEECKIDFLKQFPHYHGPIQFLPIGITTHTILPYASFSALGYPFTHENVFIHVGSFVPEKNHQGLLAIFENYLRLDPTARLLLIGEGKLQASIKQMVREKQLEQSIFFLGKRADVLQILPLCKGLLLPSLIEGLPGVLLEGMYSKIPVIAYHVGGVGEVVTPQTGFLIEKNNASGFVQAMVQAAQLPKEAVQCTNAYQLVIENYTNEKIAKDFEKAYKQIIIEII